MSIQVSKNYTDTSTGVKPAIEIAPLNFATDFRVERNTPSEAILTNLTSPIGLPERFRFAASDVKDIYAGTSVDRAYQALSKRGSSVLIQLNDTWTLTDTEKPDFIQALPLSCHLVVKVPQNGYLTTNDVMSFIGRMLGGLFETGSITNERLTALLRGSLIPK